MKTALARLVVPLQLKAVADEGARTFEGLAAVWEQDLGNDVIHKGAFKQTIKDWKASGEALPLLNSHDHFDIFAAIGQLIEAKETDEGLWTKWEVIDGPEGDAVMRRLRPSPTTKRAVVGKMSIGFEPVEFSFEQPEGSESFFDRIRHITKINLKEVSLVLFPMAPGASIDVTSVKHFMASAQATDPKSLTADTKMELRRLASRIGLLLKPSAKTETPPPDDDESQDPKDPSEGILPPPTDDPALASPPNSSDDDSAADDEDEDTEKSQGTTTESKQSASGGVYLFQEALQQRLQKGLLKHKVASITDR